MNRWWKYTAIACLALLVRPHAASAMAMDMADHGRYLGKPDLALASAMIAAGGGPRHFSSRHLSAMLTAQHDADEIQRLDARFGVKRVQRYFVTFDAFVDAAIADIAAKHIALPRPEPLLARDPYELAASLRAAGVMPDGRFDIGYFIEHLISRPVHVDVMRVANASAAIGPAANADFHVILTSEMNDLKSLYHLPR